jgi:hypothetical protein
MTRAVSVLTVAGGALVLCASGSASGAGQQVAHAARAVSVRDEGRLHLVKASGSLLIDEGTVSGTFPGKVRVRFTYDGNPNVTAQITIYGHAGSVLARGGGRLSSPTSPSPSFKGALTIVGGSGRYARARGGGELFGVFYRRSFGITVQTRGVLRY